ncbi:MAG: LD-carboxypeptidase [Lachnospiraceae bacterium]|nr:LD-carboxypeptidase [Lachnospiraceae bacterium]
MIYPKFLKENDTIGITAVSAGIEGEKLKQLDLSEDNIRAQGHKIVETNNVRAGGVVSSTGKERAKQLKELFEDDTVQMVLCAAGGDFLIDMLPYVNYETIKANPKWIQGYSDPTSLLYSVTTLLDIATIYGFNGGGYGMRELHRSHEDSFAILRGDIVEQGSFEFHEGEKDGKLDGYVLTEPVYWKNLNGEEVSVKGRLLGGCLECLADIIGTPYDGTKKFLEKYKSDGVLWYFDIFGLRSEQVYNTLWHMKQAGWFEGAAGFMFGRVMFPGTFLDMTYEEAIVRALGDAPIVFNMDIGHVAPRMTVINGAMGELSSRGGKGTLKMSL